MSPRMKLTEHERADPEREARIALYAQRAAAGAVVTGKGAGEPDDEGDASEPEAPARAAYQVRAPRPEAKPEPASPPAKSCPSCGGEVPPSKRYGKPRVYCSRACKHRVLGKKWRAAHPKPKPKPKPKPERTPKPEASWKERSAASKATKREAAAQRPCRVCGQPVGPSTRAPRIYCGLACAGAAIRRSDNERKRAAKAAAAARAALGPAPVAHVIPPPTPHVGARDDSAALRVLAGSLRAALAVIDEALRA